jgi:FkbM family methyltransferase
MNNLARKIGWNIRRWMRRYSFDVIRFDEQNADYQILRLIERRGVEHIIDVGANCGQFATYIRLQGYRGHIHSFEPLPDAFAVLQNIAVKDDKIHVYNVALSDRAGTSVLHVGSNNQTSSLHDFAALDNSDLKMTHDVTVTVDTLDNLLSQGPLSAIDPSKILLKLDVQGHELQALLGAQNNLRFIPAVFLEAGLVRLYEGEASYVQLIDHMDGYGLKIKAFKGGYYHPQSGQLSQIDILFEKI